MRYFVAKVVNILIWRPYYRIRLNKVGKKFRFGHGGNIQPCNSFQFGDDFFAGPHCYFTSNTDAMIRIGNNVMFGPHCFVVGGNHNISWENGPMNKAPLSDRSRGIEIENDVWVGANSIILDGGSIGEGAVIGAGSVVRGRVPPYSIYIGNPGHVVKQRFSSDKLQTVLAANASKYSKDQIASEYEKACAQSN